MIKAVIFDLDDTLISEKQYVESGYRCVSEVISVRTGIDRGDIYNILKDLFLVSPKNVFDRMFKKLLLPHTKEDIMETVEIYRNHVPDIKFYDDVLPCLELLKAKGIRTGIITDGYISAQRKKLEVLFADKFFDHIIITDEIGMGYRKPNPRAFELMKQVLRVDFNEMMYIGDNPEKDFYIGSIYPVRTVRIYREGLYKDSSYFENTMENYTVRSLKDLAELFRQ